MDILVCITGASGSMYGVRLIAELKKTKHTVHCIISESGKEILTFETGITIEHLKKHVDVYYENSDLFAAPASGSFPLDAMVVVPCSMKTLSAIANGYGDTLISRAGTCRLKEEKPLILVPRETPVDLAGLRNMVHVREAGATILPAMPGFYHKPTTIDDMVNFIVGKILDHLNIKHSLFPKWK
jgi:4-hydroxy-3-polyprenylbenzoate decarboxylase